MESESGATADAGYAWEKVETSVRAHVAEIRAFLAYLAIIHVDVANPVDYDDRRSKASDACDAIEAEIQQLGS